MAATISLLVPTRGRPQVARRFLDSVAARTADPEAVDVVLYVDEDDRESHDLGDDRLRIIRIIGPAATMGAYNATCLERASGDIVVLMNDDVVIRTSGWDGALRDVHRQFPDGVYLAYGNDLFKRARVATFPILSRLACRILVDPYPRRYRGGLIDYHLFDIFKRLQKLGHDRIRYLPDVVFEHLHYRTGKVPFDATYRRRERFGDDATFIALRAQRQLSAARLAAVIQGRPLPPFEAADVVEEAPRTLVGALADYARAFLGDRGLPVSWRMFLFTWYSGRFLAARGYL